MGIFKKVKEAVTETVKALDEVMPQLPAPPPKPKPKPGNDSKFARGAAVLAFAFVGPAACNGVDGHPSPRPKFGEDDPQPGYTCSYDGNGKCPTTPAPDVRATCDEPASWCPHTQTEGKNQ